MKKMQLRCQHEVTERKEKFLLVFRIFNKMYYHSCAVHNCVLLKMKNEYITDTIKIPFIISQNLGVDSVLVAGLYW